MAGYATHHHEANLYSVAFSAQALSTGGAWDLFGIRGSTDPITRIELVSIDLSFSASAVSATPQALSLTLLRGSTASSTTAFTPLNLKGWTGVPTASSSATSPSSTPVSTASATLIWAEAVNVAHGWHFPPKQADAFTRPVIASGQRLHVRLATPQAALVASATLTFKRAWRGPAVMTRAIAIKGYRIGKAGRIERDPKRFDASARARQRGSKKVRVARRQTR